MTPTKPKAKQISDEGGVECPHCGCIDSHPVEQTKSKQIARVIRRRRHCVNCDQTFHTREIAETPPTDTPKGEN